MGTVWRAMGFLVAVVHGGYAVLFLGAWLGINAMPDPGASTLFVACGTTCIYFAEQAFPKLRTRGG